jgi:hypothetical protein
MPYQLCPQQQHYFDPAKNKECPFCPPGGNSAAGSAPNLAPGAGGDAEIMAAGDPPVGWLVAINGPDCGKDFTLRMGNNAIGALPTMAVPIAGDPGVSREEHAVIAYDARSNRFLIRPGAGRALAYRNGAPVETTVQLQTGDQITVGQTKLIFIPLAGDNFRWNFPSGTP